MDVVAFPAEGVMRANIDLDKGITWRARTDTGASLPAQTEHGPIANSRRNCDVERRAVGQGDLLLAAVDGIQKIEFELVVRIAPARTGASPRLSAEYLRQKVIVEVRK